MTQNVCTDCHNNLIAYWLYAMAVDSFDDAVPRLKQVLAGERPIDFPDPAPAASMLENLIAAAPTTPAELKAERVTFQYTPPSKGLLGMVLGEKAEIASMLYDEMMDKYKPYSKKMDSKLKKSMSLKISDATALMKLMYYSSRYYDMKWKLAFTKNGRQISIDIEKKIKEAVVTEIDKNNKKAFDEAEKKSKTKPNLPSGDEVWEKEMWVNDFVGEELDPVGDAAQKLSDDEMKVIDEIGNCCGYAEMMYALSMPKPQHTPEWQSWYLCKLLGPDWSLLHCRSDTTYYPE